MSSQFEIASATHSGIRRKGSPNQDSVKVIESGLFGKNPPVLIVADGMGGYTGGALASKLVVKSFAKAFSKRIIKLSQKEILEKSIQESHQLIRAVSLSNLEYSMMGSTVVATILEKDHLHVINVGDSRLYLFRNKQTQQLSFDQSIVAEKVRKGEISKEEAYDHPQKNQLTMSISAQREIVSSYYSTHTLEPNDVILLCSDGLWGTVPLNLIRAVSCQLKPSLAVKKLIALANEFGGPDNISVIIARYKGSSIEIDED